MFRKCYIETINTPEPERNDPYIEYEEPRINRKLYDREGFGIFFEESFQMAIDIHLSDDQSRPAGELE